ncbi:hypothetical protein [Aestuariivita sp.]|jgi:DNA repair exonuclease SbcCD ATPase subunit|uniref:hypothetical protein n=1 Tax=Aestuariivita sp. TaxID=1872407 RepID=UPI00216D3D47|nr:hypothetical protein [Aestuariivita sp.]MCE8009884.1 hypothetical protein [Aestuariivita sp.]
MKKAKKDALKDAASPAQHAAEALAALQEEAAATAQALLSAQALVQDCERELENQHAAHRAVTDQLAQQRQTTQTATETSNQLLAALEELTEQHAETTEENKRLRSELTARFNELTVFTDMLKRAEADKAALADQVKALQTTIHGINTLPGQIQQMLSVLLDQTRRPYLPQRTILNRQLTLLRATAILDEDWYLEYYPDVVGTGLTAAAHFIMFGNAEGRVPNARIAALSPATDT